MKKIIKNIAPLSILSRIQSYFKLNIFVNNNFSLNTISLIIFFIIFAIPQTSFSLFHKIGLNHKIKTIKEAINLCNDNDTILVTKGVYKEGNIIIQKSVSIIGENGAIIDGQSKFEIFTIATKNVTIKGLVLQNSGKSNMEDFAAIKCYDAHYVKIINNKLENTFFGIHLSNTDHAKIINNELHVKPKMEHELGNGIHLWKCDSAKIENNKINGHRDGIYFEFATNCKIKNNISVRNLRYGLHFMFSHNNQYIKNTFKNNGAGVAVMYTTNVLMKDNVFIDNWGESSYGLLLKDIRESEIINNKFTKNTIGIYMEGTTTSKFKNNVFLENGWAIKLQASCDRNYLNENKFIANTFDIATNGITFLNNIDNNYWDKYEGYDLNSDKVGDVPYMPVNLFATIVERIPTSIMLWRSMLVFLLDKSEKVIPIITPPTLKDNYPLMKKHEKLKF